MAGGLPLLPDGDSVSWGGSWEDVQVTRRLQTREPAGTRGPPRASREHVPRRTGRERRLGGGSSEARPGRERAWCDRAGVQADGRSLPGETGSTPPSPLSLRDLADPREREPLSGKGVWDSKVTLLGFAGARRGGPRLGPAQAGIPRPRPGRDTRPGGGQGVWARRWPPLPNREPHGAEANHRPAGPSARVPAAPRSTAPSLPDRPAPAPARMPAP